MSKNEKMEVRFKNGVNIPVGKQFVSGELIIPMDATAMIIFSHGSGSSRFSKRNLQVARFLQEKNMGTLLPDLLTETEDSTYSNRFDIDLLTKRLADATEWLAGLPATKQCRIGYFGASTGAASALRAAARLPQIGAVVCRGGRPDLAMDELKKVKAPTLLIVGSLDYEVLQLNRQAFAQLNCEKKLSIVEGATHLFEEKGKMDIVSALAGSWFEKKLQPVTAIK